LSGENRGRGSEITALRKDHTTFPAIVFSNPMVQSDKSVGLRGVIVDITERKQMEEALREREEAANRLAQENAVMAEIGRIISSSLNIEEVYGRFADEARKLLPFERIVINLINPDQETMTVTYLFGLKVKGRCVGDIMPLKKSILERTMQGDRIVELGPLTEKEVEDQFPTFLPAFQAGLRRLISVPLNHGGG
jgi:PAS domain-containing protein